MPWKFRTRHRCKRFLYRSDIILNVSSTVPPSDGKYDPGVDGNLAGDPLDWSWPVPRHCRPSPLPSQGQQVQRERIIKDCVWNSTNITSILYKSNHALHQVPNKQKNFFWEISPKFVYPPTHPRIFVRFGRTKGEIRVKKGDLGEISPKKYFFLFNFFFFGGGGLP